MKTTATNRRTGTGAPRLSPPGGRAKIIPADVLMLPYQRRWVLDQSRLKIAEKSRQIGWTWAAACGMVRRQMCDGAPLDAWISSRDERQAALFLEDCRRFAKVLHRVARGRIPVRLPGADSVGTLVLGNGRRIHSLSSNPEAQAGKRGDRVLDEFALHPDPKRLYTVAYPGITWGGQLEIFSTHRGSGNYFNTLINEIRQQGNPKGFSYHRVTLQDALEQGFLYKLQGRLPAEDPRQQMDEGDYYNFIRAGCPDEESFLQEYACVPGDDAAAFLTYQLIEGCEYPEGEPWQVQPAAASSCQGALFVGVDIGRERDLTVIWVVEQRDGQFHTRSVEVFAQAPFDVQEQALAAWLRQSRVWRCCIDQTGLGRQFAERAIRQFGARRVEGITFTEGLKEELAWGVRVACEQKSVRIPGDAHIRADLRAVRKGRTAAGNPRFTAERGPQGHADRFWALALALHAGRPVAVPRATVG